MCSFYMEIEWHRENEVEYDKWQNFFKFQIHKQNFNKRCFSSSFSSLTTYIVRVANVAL